MAGPTSGGTSDRIQYSGTVNSVSFGATPATFLIQRTTNTFDAGAPAGSGTVNLIVNDGTQTVTAGTYTYVANTTVSSSYSPAVPVGLGVDGTGRVVACDAHLGAIDQIGSNAGIASQIFANTDLIGARAFAVSSGDIGMYATSANDVKQIQSGGSPILLFSGSSTPWSGGVNGIAIFNTTSTSFKYYIATPTGDNDMFGNPLSTHVTSATRVAVGSSGNIYTLTGSTPAVVETDPAGNLLNSFGAYVSGGGALQFQGPGDIAVDTAGDVFVLDGGNGRIEKFSSTGTLLATYPTSVRTSTAQYGMTVTSTGALYVVNSTAGTIEVIQNA